MTVRLAQPYLLRYTLAATFLSVALFQGPALASESISIKEWDIVADKVIRYQNPDSVIALGNVTLSTKSSSTAEAIRGDWLAYDIIEDTIKVRGNITLNDEAIVNAKNSTSPVNHSQDDIIISRKVAKTSTQLHTLAGSYSPFVEIGEWTINKKSTAATAPTTVATQESIYKPEPILQPLVGKETFSTDDWEIAADQILQLETPDSVVAMGNVMLRKKPKDSDEFPTTLYADWVAYDLDLGTIKTKGNVRIVDNTSSTTDANKRFKEVYINNQQSNSGVVATNAVEYNTVDDWLISYQEKDIKPPEASPSQVAAASSSSTSTEEWDISADRVMRYDNPNSVVAIGDVVLTKRELIPTKINKPKQQSSSWNDLLGEPVAAVPITTMEEAEEVAEPQYKTTTTIYADWISYDMDLGVIKARGNVRIDNGDDELYASEGDVVLDNETGSFENATIIQENKLHLEGKEVTKTGFNTYHIVDGWVITCKLEDGETPPWSIASSETTVEADGYAILKHARFNVKGVPIFYTPYMVLPVKSTRQTGFLMPEITSSSNSGFGAALPFFWNISESTDLTLYSQYLTERGFMPGADFRYVLSADEKGSFGATYLSDDLDPSETDYIHLNSDRYWIRGKADHTFGDGWVTRLDIDVVSDYDYLSEFNSGSTGFDDSNSRFLDTFGRGFASKTSTSRDNTLEIAKSWDSSFLQIGLLAVNDIRLDDDGEEDTDTDQPFWELPNISYTGAVPLLADSIFSDNPVTLDWDTQYVNFWREDGYGGHRFDVAPTLGTNLPLGEYLESSAEVGIRDTYYKVEEYGSPTDSDDIWDDESTKNRFMYNAEVEIATTLERDYFSSDNSGGGVYHSIRPYLKYNYTPYENQEDLPYFDSEDRVDQENGITYGFDTDFSLLGNDANGNSKGRTYAHFEMYQTYNLEDVTLYDSDGDIDESSDDFSDLYAKMQWYPWSNASISYKTEFNMYGDDFVSHTFATSYTSERGDSARVEYSFKEDDDIEQINGYFSLNLAANWSAKLEIEHSLYDEETEEALFGLTYRQPCWSVTLGTEYTPEDTTFIVLFELANIGVPLGTSSSLR